MNIISRFISKYLLALYVNSALQEKPIRFIIISFLGFFLMLFLSLSIIYLIIQGTYEGGLDGYISLGLLILLEIIFVIAITARILGYLHRDKIRQGEIPWVFLKKILSKGSSD